MTERRVPCVWCGGVAIEGSTCPRAVHCPQCQAPPGAPCKRPSGHRAAELHHARVSKAEAIPPGGSLAP